ncbi:protein kinase domain-containing protein [Nocardiopsis suaedae]|uniref:Protein kinase n=1 Tax=Nocardiopsis suaedae TaxID=3018444 RepID=A0ABT4TX36_9ACTN|nr:protein kinase [Nocardiopsis suaedae]MDA2808692.1 protein kinase [Nocardiopsis suaedae]
MRATADETTHRIGPYRIERYLGRDGYAGRHLGRDRDGVPVVVTVPRVSGGGGRSVRRELARDIEAARIATRYGPARVLAADLVADVPWVATEYIEGPTLLEAVRRHGPLRGEELHKLALGTSAALSVLHWFGLAHGDLTPSNIVLGSDAPKVTGAGFARAFAAARPDLAARAATPAYTAPEHSPGAEPRPEEDVYAWAAVMLFAATAREPHDRRELPEDPSARPPAGAVMDKLRELVPRCLSGDPAHRLTAERLMVSVVAACNRGRVWRPEARLSSAPRTVPVPRTEALRPVLPFRFDGCAHGSPHALAGAMHAAPKRAADLFADVRERGRLLSWLSAEVQDTSLDRGALASRFHRPDDAAAMFVAHFRPDLAAGFS